VKGYIAVVENESEVCVPLVSLGKNWELVAMDKRPHERLIADDLQDLESVADICAASHSERH